MLRTHRSRILAFSDRTLPLLSRRAFLHSLAVAFPIAALVRRAHAAAIDELVTGSGTLQAVGEAVLPSELGRARIGAAVSEFQRWIADYREDAELLHGYGTSVIERTGPTPATRWAAQLDGLDAAATKEGVASFAALTLKRRREIMTGELDAIKADRLGAVSAAPHVAVALLSHWYGTAAATDRCYDARIGRQLCRPLGASTHKPLPLARSRA